MAGLDPPLTIPNDKIVKWHPSFPLECIADIEPSPLPQPPDTPSCSSARDLLHMAASSSMAPRVQQALETVAESTATPPEEPPEPITLNPVIEKALKGLPQSLIDKVNTTDLWLSSP